MLLRGSGEHSGDEYDLGAIVAEDGADGGIDGAALLTDYADAFFDDAARFAAARAALQSALGDAALVDAAAVLAVFNAVVKIADATGIPLEDEKARLSEDFRGDLGIDAYPSARSG